MKKLNYYLFCLFVLNVMFSFSLNEKVNGQTVIVKLSPAPQGKLGIADLWNVSLTNISNETYEIYLFGTLTEKSDGLIATATTTSFDLKKGTRKIKASDFPTTPDVTYPSGNPKYKKALVMTGSLPQGEYEYCVYARLKSNNNGIGSDCLEQVLEDMRIISLMSPSDGEKIDPKIPLTFTWMSPPLPKNTYYTLKVVEVRAGQSPEIAFKLNTSWFEKTDIKTNSFSYPKVAKPFETGNKYAWGVSFGGITSEIFTLEISELEQTGPVIISLIPTGNCCYKMNVWQGTGGYFSSFKFMSSNIASANSEPGYSIINQNLPTDFVLKTNNSSPFPIGNISFVGTVCFNSSSSPIPITIGWSTNNGETYTNQFDTTITCSSEICDNFNDNNSNDWTMINTIGTIDNPGLDKTDFLRVNDQPNGSYIFNSVDYSGNWNAYIGKCLSWDYKVFNDGNADATVPIHPYVYIYSGPAAAPNLMACFVSTTTVNENTGWVHVSAPIALCTGGIMPEGWTMSIGSGCGDWANLLLNVTGVRFSVDLGSSFQTEDQGFDNVCIMDCQCECCEFITNCSFEQTNSVPTPGTDGIISLPGWVQGQGSISTGSSTNTPDIFTMVPDNITDNLLGPITPYDGNNCAGISVGYIDNQFNTESFAAVLTGVTSSNTYKLTAKMKIGMARTAAADIEVWLYSTTEPDVNKKWQSIGWMTIWDNSQWVTFEKSVNPKPGVNWDRLVIKGYKGAEIYGLSYVFIDCINFCIGPPCYDAKANVDIPNRICYEDLKYLDFSTCKNETFYMVGITETTIDNVDFGPNVVKWFPGEAGTFDLINFAAPTLTFVRGHYYHLTLAVSNPCTQWEPYWQTFYVDSCFCKSCPTGSTQGPNLVVNGDFMLGGPLSSPSSSDFSWKAPPGALTQGEYSIRNSNNLNNSKWACTDHTGVNGYFFVCDNTPYVQSSPNEKIAWRQSVSVTSGKQYIFCAWVKNIVTSNYYDPIINIKINGNYTPMIITLPETSAPDDGWRAISAYYTATSTGNINLEIYSSRNKAVGDDFALDDISFFECTTPAQDCHCDILIPPKVIKVTPGSGTTTTLNCQQYYTLYGSNPTLNFEGWQWTCSPPSFLSSGRWEVYSGYITPGNLISGGPGLNLGKNFSYDFINQVTAYSVKFYSMCCDNVCDTCSVIIKRNLNECLCNGDWNSTNTVTYYRPKITEPQQISSVCGNNMISNNVLFGSQMTFQISPYTCLGSCTTMYQWVVMRMPGSIIEYLSPVEYGYGNPISFIYFPQMPDQKYIMGIVPICGQSKCDTCWFGFHTANP